eukprot:TRINITY_DN4535_c0_g1_i1.p1 TRINITY_DN4535_c0_g1~~TRINITY_DN4535_c0_g1_i1.p1  ORF type:complete len:719 (+),score=188.75 TRINITY_DN4535_c0_g1_i1:331-2487(+)
MAQAEVSLLDGRYEIGDLLGMGASGSVYKGKDIQTGKGVAIKQISLAKLKKKQIAEMMSELELLQSFDHRNIVKILGFVKSPKDLAFILEFMENGSLTKTLKQLGSFPEFMVASYMRQILNGMVYLHERSIIHRDIKGDNMLISSDGRVCLGDFGLAKKIDVDSPDEDVDVVGTPYWLAPEVILMSAQTTASDIWSLGCTIIELLTGNPPYSNFSSMGAIFHMVQDDHPPLPKGISPSLERFLLSCFDKDIQQRATASQLLEHEWITTGTAPVDIRDMRQSISIYNRSPTVVEMPAKPLETTVNEAFEKDKEELAEVNIEVEKSLADASVVSKQAKGLSIISRLNYKLGFIQKRIIKRQTQEDMLIKISKIYGKLLKEERENYEKQLKVLQDALYVDLKVQPTLQTQIKTLKETLFDTAKALVSCTADNEGDLAFEKDDILYILNKADTNKYIAEHSVTGKQGYVNKKDVATFAVRERTFTKKNLHGEEQVLTAEQQAQETLESIEAKSRKDKLGGFFGASGVEIEKGLRHSKDKISFFTLPSLSNSPSGSVDSLSSSPRIRGISRTLSKFGKKESVEDGSLAPSLLEAHPELDNRELVREGTLLFGVHPTDKFKLVNAFLFSDIVVFTKKKSNFPIVAQVPLEDARIILVGDDENHKNEFQLQHKGVIYTLVPAEKDLILATKTRNVWFHELKQIVREYQKKRLLSLVSPRSPSPVI